MTPLWTWHELQASLGLGEGDGPDVTGVSIDTRTLVPGDLFVALKDQRDGHEFVGAAFKAGAAAGLVAAEYQGAGFGPLLRVPNTLQALEAIARSARSRLANGARVVGVTGSAGKTGTKEMLRACLSPQGETHGSEKSYNNHWGVPLTLARMPRDTRYGVFEIGMNHAGEIRPLTKMVAPHAAIITTVEAVHLEHFPSVEAIADAKAEIFEGALPGGAAVIKHDNPHASRLRVAAEACSLRAISFGFAPGADVSGTDLQASDVGSRFTAHVAGKALPVSLSIPGRHIAENALAVIAAVDAIGADVQAAVEALAAIEPPPGRGARMLLQVGGGNALLIDESYNANPASMRAALATLATVPRDKFARRIAILGDMLELGPDAEKLHENLKDAVDHAGVDLVFACGMHMKRLYGALSPAQRAGYALSAQDLVPHIVSALAAGDVVMVKASNGTRLGSVVAELKAQFC